MARDIMSQFFKDKQSGLKTITRTGKPITVAFVPITKMNEEMPGVGAAAYTKPVVVLTNESSASASEIFSIAMKDTKRATIIGQRTCGCLLGYFGLADVPGGGQMAYSEIGFISSNGFRIEGDGVTPDIEVKLTREDYLFNRDRVLERAVAFLAAPPKP
jgi:C-terminal processing protease CtpA/Prc